MMQQVYKSFPNNIPITGICIVEDPSKCPQDFIVVLKTHDQDSDADLWRESTLFGKRVSRYLCFSKSEGIMDYIVQNISIVSEKEVPPEGYSYIPKTADGDSKAWRKKQICYSYIRKSLANTAVTDIILLSKSKQPPEGFSLAGSINGITVCFKTTEIQSNGITISSTTTSCIQNIVNKSGGVNGYPSLSGATSPGDYVNLTPVRPAPLPPQLPPKPGNSTPGPTPGTYATLSGHLELEGIPFVLNPHLSKNSSGNTEIPVIKAKTAAELDREFYYDFRLERQTST